MAHFQTIARGNPTDDDDDVYMDDEDWDVKAVLILLVNEVVHRERARVVEEEIASNAAKAAREAEVDTLCRPLVHNLIDELFWGSYTFKHGARETHTKVQVTKTAGNLFHAVGTVRALHGRKEKSREGLRRLAADGFRHATSQHATTLNPATRVARTKEQEERMYALFPLSIKPDFVKYLTRERPMNPKTGEKPKVSSPWECRMTRAYCEMQTARNYNGLPNLTWLPDEFVQEYMTDHMWEQWRQEQRQMPKESAPIDNKKRMNKTTFPAGRRPGGRVFEYLHWFGERLRNENVYATFYDLEMLAWSLPEQAGFVVYYIDAEKKLAHVNIGPQPRPDSMPYELMWSGDDQMLFWPLVLKADREAVQAVADSLSPPIGCVDWCDRDMFKALGISHDQYDDALKIMQYADPEGRGPTDEQMAARLNVTLEQAHKLQLQRAAERLSDVELNELRITHRLAGKRKFERTRFRAVGLKIKFFNDKDWRHPEIKRHRRVYKEGIDEKPAIDALDPLVMFRVNDAARALGKKLRRRPTPRELAALLGVDEFTAAQMFDQAQEKMREIDCGVEDWEFQWMSDKNTEGVAQLHNDASA